MLKNTLRKRREALAVRMNVFRTFFVKISNRKHLRVWSLALKIMRTMKWMKAEKERTDGSYSCSGATSASVDDGSK
jgi:hypothetical protein